MCMVYVDVCTRVFVGVCMCGVCVCVCCVVFMYTCVYVFQKRHLYSKEIVDKM